MERQIKVASDGKLVEEEINGDNMRMTSKADPDNNQVDNPLHYQSYVKELNVDAITCMRAAFGDDAVQNFCICNALKYLYRHQSKGGKTDILKCKWYIDKYLELGGCE